MLVIAAISLFLLGFLNVVSGAGIADKQPGMGFARLLVGFGLHILALVSVYVYGAS